MQEVKIKRIRKIERTDRYDLTVNSTSNFFANGVLIHNTSGRIGNVLVERELGFWERLAQKLGMKVKEHEWKYLNGTRRVVLSESSGNQFHDPTIRDRAFKIFDGNLRKGETAYLEIVGYESTGAPIMPSVDTKGLGDKDFTKRYSEKMHYSYGCEPGQCDFYLYRMTLTNEDGQSVDYSWDDVVARAKEIGVKTVPHFYTGSWGDVELDYRNQHAIPQGTEVDDRDVREHFSKIVESLGSGPSALDVRHIKEGVCVRIEGGLHNKTFKFKSFEFKVLEQIIKDHNIVDPEEAQG
jgi:hypothetical protein